MASNRTNKVWLGLCIAVASSFSVATAAEELSPRTLYYRVKPEPAAAKAAPARSTTAVASRKRDDTHPASRASGTQNETPEIQKVSLPAVPHLGFRYDIVLVENGSGTVDSTQPLKTGQCFVLNVEVNYPGYLYVFSQGSSGNWTPLYPSSEMPDESNLLRARTPMRIPQEHCFVVNEPSGDEHLFLVLSRNVEGMRALDEAVRGKTSVAPAHGAEARPEAVLTAQMQVDEQVVKLSHELRGRDLGVKRIAKPLTADEPANSVYVVDVSDKPNDRIITDVLLHHQ